MKRLEALGWWFNDLAPTGLPRPQLLVGALAEPMRTLVLSYLRQGKVLVRYPESSHCRFACGEVEMGRADLTDGTFAWPEGLAHYVEHHSVRLPERFLQHVEQRKGTVNPFTPPKPVFGLLDMAPWLAWANQQRACLDLEGWDTPTGTVLDRVAEDLGNVPHDAILLCRGSTREVVLAVDGNAIEVHQLRPGGHPPQRFAGWHEWPLAAVGPIKSKEVAQPPSKPGRGLSLQEFLAAQQLKREPKSD